MSDVTVAGAQIIALISAMGGILFTFVKMYISDMRKDRDFFRDAYFEKEKNEGKQLQVMSEGITALRLLLEERKV